MKSNKGFTLIELIVVMAIFLFVTGAAIGIFFSIISSQKKIFSEQQIINQISYVQEYMSKALRAAKTDADGVCIPSGYIYLLTHNDGSKYQGIKFINASNGACQEFYFNAGVLYEKKGAGTEVPITSASLQFDLENPIRFSVSGKDGSVFGQGCSSEPNSCGAISADGSQPKVTILINVKIAGENRVRTIQTTVSRRTLNI